MVKLYENIAEIITAHIPTVTCVIGLVNFIHILQAAQPEN